MAVVKYRCPDCREDVETFAAQHSATDRDEYESILCPKCQLLHSVNPADGKVAADDELGDPW